MQALTHWVPLLLIWRALCHSDTHMCILWRHMPDQNQTDSITESRPDSITECRSTGQGIVRASQQACMPTLTNSIHDIPSQTLPPSLPLLYLPPWPRLPTAPGPQNPQAPRLQAKVLLRDWQRRTRNVTAVDDQAQPDAVVGSCVIVAVVYRSLDPTKQELVVMVQ